ncbi:MAG: AarF/ABC1/UbiB kinase family protein [archaeon]|jgi:ubiquinone biosynthesis protein|nr:AarF/ABC1/UbiB kinase family protein [archaeon]MDA1130871.1 AarF/ABC1/UbiB kinase family protein [archaeon]
MRLLTLIQFGRQIYGKKPIDVDKIQKMGLLAVKLGQICALRPDLIDSEKCLQLQKLYSSAYAIPQENFESLLDKNTSDDFRSNFESIESKSFAAASIGQIHRAKLLDGTDVVIKIVKSNFEKSFRRDVRRMKRWVSMGLFFYPRLKKVGNPLGLLAHIEDYTVRELNLLNEIKGKEKLEKIATQYSDKFPMPKLRFPKIWKDISNERVLVVEYIAAPTLEKHLDRHSFEWDDMLQLFRIHGAYMFGIGVFHGDLHPGNVMMDEDNNFIFIDTGAICEAPENVRTALFGFFYFLAKGQLKNSFDAMLSMAKIQPTGDTLETYYKSMFELYDGFVGTSVSEVSLTQQMMKTIKASVLAGCTFGEDTFPIIRSLMYMDGMVLKGHPQVDLITSMGPYLDEFSQLIDLSILTNIEKN